MIYIPEQIKSIIKDRPYEINEVGMSNSHVLVFDEYVLKIQKTNNQVKNEINMLNWLKNKVPVPEIASYVEQEDISYTLMTKINGTMLCHENLLKNPDLLIKLVAQGMKQLWTVDIKSCPYTYSSLEQRLKDARFNVENNLLDEDVEPETYGPNGFKNPTELLEWLEANKPEEDLVLTHGDFCLPNIFTENGTISGFIDCGFAGPADRWQDVAIAIRSLQYNFDGKYNGGKPYCKFEPQMLLDELGIKMDPAKNKYYKLLDELF